MDPTTAPPRLCDKQNEKTKAEKVFFFNVLKTIDFGLFKRSGDCFWSEGENVIMFFQRITV